MYSRAIRKLVNSRLTLNYWRSLFGEARGGGLLDGLMGRRPQLFLHRVFLLHDRYNAQKTIWIKAQGTPKRRMFKNGGGAGLEI
jgi:hypothetical protein